VAFVVNLVLSLWLFRVIGREGVPIATVITVIATNIVNMYYSSRLTGTTFFGLLPIAGLLKRMVVALVPGIPLWFALPYVDAGSFVHLALLGGAYMAAYVVLCSLVGYLTLEDIRTLLGRSKES